MRYKMQKNYFTVLAELFYSISGEPSEVLYQVEPKDQVGADGMARGIVAGTYDDEGTCV